MRTLPNYCLILLLSLLLLDISGLKAQAPITVNPIQAGFDLEGLQNYEDFLQREIDAKRIPGAVSMVYRKGALAHKKSFGFNNMDAGTPMEDDKIFYIQSMTKPIISIAFMTLYEDGLFFLDDPVSKYLPEFENLKVLKVEKGVSEEPVISYVPLNEPVRIWHLLSHTAGFSHGLGNNEYEKKLVELLYETEHNTIQDRVAALASYPLMGQPGKQWNYSASPDVLAVLIEHFSGKSPAEFLKERIFDPLGMGDTDYNVSDENLERLVGLHQPDETGALHYVEPWGPVQGNTVYGGTHGLFSTAADYMKFGKMILNNGKGENGSRIISRKTLELMGENHIEGLPYGPGNGFGLGFGVRTDISDSKLSGSNGTMYWGGMFNTYFFVDPTEDLVAILMTQHFPYTNFYSNKLRQFVYSAIND